jgi:hypothetical protein
MSGAGQKAIPLPKRVREDCSRDLALRVSRGLGLLRNNNADTRAPGRRMLREEMMSLNLETIPLFLHPLLQLKPDPSPSTDQAGAIRDVIGLLGECCSDLSDELVRPYAKKILTFILIHLQTPTGSIDKMHEQCSLTLVTISSSLSPGPVLGGLLALYETKQRTGDRFQHLQLGLGRCIVAQLHCEAVQTYLREKPESLTRLTSRLIELIRSPGEWNASHILLILRNALEMIEESRVLVIPAAPQVISHAIQAMSSKSDALQSPLESGGWRNRSEGAHLLGALPQFLGVEVCQPYSKEVIFYLNDSRHDRVGPDMNRKGPCFDSDLG